MFYGEHGIALHAMQGNRASSCGEGEVSCIFSSCSRNLGYILEIRRGWPFKTSVCSVMSGLLSRYEGHSGISTRLGRAIGMLLKVRPGTDCAFLVATVILGFLSIFNKSRASSPFETLNST